MASAAVAPVGPVGNSSSTSGAVGNLHPLSVAVDADFKDGELYDVFCPEGSDEPWHVVVSIQENGKFTHWALMQMLQAKDWDVDFEWAVFMKTGRCGSSGLRHFSKKFTDGAAAFKTFADWFEDKTANRWLGDFTTSQDAFNPQPGKYHLLTPEQGKHVLEHRGEKERPRPKLGISDVPVDIYFKDRDQYQVYVTPDGDLWTAVMSIKEGERHSQYAILQVLVAKPDVKVEFDYVVFMRHGKLGGSAQRYAKRYTVEVAALSTFQQWFKEKTGNEWYGSFKDSLEEFSPQIGKFCLLERSEWTEVVEFEERSKIQLIDSDVAVDAYYRDRESYRVYHTETGELWAAVLSRKDENGFYKRFVLLQMLAKKPQVTVDFDYVVLRRIGERGESGQWTAKKFTNELDALRTFKMWFQDETGNQWKGSFHKSFAEFHPVPNKMVLLPQAEWEEATREVPLVYDSSQLALESFLAEGRRSRLMNSNTAATVHSAVGGSNPSASFQGPQKVSIDILKKAMAAEESKPDLVHSSSLTSSQQNVDGEIRELVVPRGVAATKAPKKEKTVEGTPRPKAESHSTAEGMPSPSKPPSVVNKKKTSSAAAAADTARSNVADDDEESDEVDSHFEHKDKYTKVIQSTKLLMKDPSGKVKFYTMQLLAADDESTVSADEKYCFFVRTGKLGAAGASNFKQLSSLESGKKSFSKKFLEKTKNTWHGSFQKTKAHFSPTAGEFELVASFSQPI